MRTNVILIGGCKFMIKGEWTWSADDHSNDVMNDIKQERYIALDSGSGGAWISKEEYLKRYWKLHPRFLPNDKATATIWWFLFGYKKPLITWWEIEYVN